MSFLIIISLFFLSMHTPVTRVVSHFPLWEVLQRRLGPCVCFSSSTPAPCKSLGKPDAALPGTHLAGQASFWHLPLERCLQKPHLAPIASHGSKDQPRGALTTFENWLKRSDRQFHPKPRWNVMGNSILVINSDFDSCPLSFHTFAELLIAPGSCWGHWPGEYPCISHWQNPPRALLVLGLTNKQWGLFRSTGVSSYF